VFTGKPHVRQIDLDLTEISGGGSCPSQFECTTSDGQDVYIRYRGGSLRIDVGDRVVYEETIGPFLHGDILIEQISELVGLTVNGRRLSLPAEEFASRKMHANLSNFSGRTLYWDRWVHSSAVGMDLFVDRIKEAFPSAILFDEQYLPPRYDRAHINWRQAASHCIGHSYLVVPQSGWEKPHQLVLESIAASELFRAQFPLYVALRPMRDFLKTNDRKYLTRCQEFYDKDFIFAGSLGSVQSQFDAENVECRYFIESVQRIFDSTFSNEIEISDLESETKVRDDRWEWSYSIDLIEWCGKSSRRFLGTRVETEKQERWAAGHAADRNVGDELRAAIESLTGQLRPGARRRDHSRTAPSSGRPHAKVITCRRITGKDPRLPVAHAEPRHSSFVPLTEVPMEGREDETQSALQPLESDKKAGGGRTRCRQSCGAGRPGVR
jgi:hypothetical protein